MNKKILLGLFILGMFIFSLNFTSSTLAEDIVAYYKFDKTSGVVLDSLEDYNGTNYGATRGEIGKINNSFYLNSSNQEVNATEIVGLSNETSICGWVDKQSVKTGNSGQLIRFNEFSDFSLFRLDQDNTHQVGLTKIGLADISLGYSLNPGFTFFCLFTNNTAGTHTLDINNGDFTNSTSLLGDFGNKLFLKLKNQGTLKIDEIGIWNRTLENFEIDQLYNSGNGLSYPFINSSNFFTVNSKNFSSSTIEGSTESFILNLTQNSTFPITSVDLVYNGTSYSSSLSRPGNDIVLTTNLQVIPQVSATTNVEFYWQISLSNSQTILISGSQQIIDSISFDNCSSFSNILYNYTLYDEETEIKLTNTTIELDLTLYDQSGEIEVESFSKIYENINPAQVCANNPLPITTTYKVDSVVKYSSNKSSGYEVEYYNLLGAELKNSTGTTNINLYDLLSEDSTVFKIIFRDSNFLPVENALIYIDRQYVSEGVFKTVELPKTDSNGEAIGHFVRNDIVYNLRVIKDGLVLGTFNNQIAFCDDFSIGNCIIQLDSVSGDDVSFNYNQELGIIFSELPTYDSNSSRVNFDFSTADGVSKQVTMIVTRNDVFGNQTLCTQTITSSSGTFSCLVDPEISDTLLKVQVVAEETSLISYIDIGDSGYGNAGYAGWFILNLFLVFAFAKNKTIIMFSIISSYIGAIAFGIAEGNIIGLGSAGIWILVMTFLGLQRLNKDKPQ